MTESEAAASSGPASRTTATPVRIALAAAVVSGVAFVALRGVGGEEAETPPRVADEAYEVEQINRALGWLAEHDMLDSGVAAKISAFDGYAEAAQSVSAGGKLTLYEGLPHPTWESVLLEQERQEHATLEIRGHSYYPTPIEPRPNDANELASLYATTGTIYPYMGEKACGGYHPDWRLVWESGDERTEVEFCFGCDESRTYHGTHEIWCDLGTGRFEQILEHYQRRRPSR